MAAYPLGEVRLASVDGVSAWGWGETRLAEFALVGTSHASYTAWGESLASAQTGDVLSPPVQAAAWARASGPLVGWQSKLLDPALGLHFNHARWYAPSLGRFSQPSPLGRAAEPAYGYGENDPLDLVDVAGLLPAAPLMVNVFADMRDSLGEANAALVLFADELPCMGSLYDFGPGGLREAQGRSAVAFGLTAIHLSLAVALPGSAWTLVMALEAGEDLSRGDLEDAAAKMVAVAGGILLRNPWGRRGSPEHQARIREVEERMRARQWQTIAGGSQRERAFGGHFPDLVMTRDGRRVAFQIGHRTLGGRPVARERQALRALRSLRDDTGAPFFDHVWFVRF